MYARLVDTVCRFFRARLNQFSIVGCSATLLVFSNLLSAFEQSFPLIIILS